ncbi:MAG TPA: rhodanese-like domain-containing protein [Gammaproteobacteria bacterium]|nr:rhodanese-like domain-containing protein [Gammaproteobacteria bacterium]
MIVLRRMPPSVLLATLLALAASAAPAAAAAPPPREEVRITPDLRSIEVRHAGRKVVIERRQDPASTINPDYARTGRPCPPFCVQPAVLAPGVETIGELEMLDYLQRVAQGDDTVLVIDSRTPDWVEKGTIPGSINVSWRQLNPEAGADPMEIADILERRFGALSQEGLWDFSAAKTLVMFCNGPWCGQSPTNIRTLLKFGYPAHKIKWYRGGMQDWESLGLTTVR